MIMVLGAPHSWMRLVKSLNTEVSDASEVPQSRGIFLAAVFSLKNQSRSSKIVSIGIQSEY